jgi:Rps23 Pro-64 3,4-dihydroxylase Tpa1-like proline 4-hydroxylase
MQIIQNFLPLNLINDVKSFVRQQTNHRSNYTSWNNNIIYNSSPIIIFDLNESLKIQIYPYLKQHKIFDESDYNLVKIMYYYFSPYSYIPWHDDANNNKAVTIYMNEQWNEDWGGYFAYEANEEIKCLKPNFNTAIVTIPPMRHTVFLVNPQAPIRESIQIFKNKCLI